MAKRHYEGYYEGLSSRRSQEREDGSMINEDHSAIANLPQEVVMRMYPKDSDYTPENLDDTMRGVDRQKGLDHSQMMKHLKPKKV